MCVLYVCVCVVYVCCVVCVCYFVCGGCVYMYVPFGKWKNPPCCDRIRRSSEIWVCLSQISWVVFLIVHRAWIWVIQHQTGPAHLQKGTSTFEVLKLGTRMTSPRASYLGDILNKLYLTHTEKHKAYRHLMQRLSVVHLYSDVESNLNRLNLPRAVHPRTQPLLGVTLSACALLEII